MYQIDNNSTKCTESTTITLEWTVGDLKHLFDTSKGESKSKVTKSPLFGNGEWQCLFYPNSGTDGGVYVSLYLSCEPTVEERANALDGKWSREVSDTPQTANWGWYCLADYLNFDRAQFARRDAVYYHSSSVRTADTFKIICSITSTSTPPVSTPVVPSQTVPKDLLDIIGNLLDDPSYSDVEFIFPTRSRSGKTKPRTIWATRAILKRADYFRRNTDNVQSMQVFEAGFAETTRGSEASNSVPGSRTRTPNEETSTPSPDFEDSDEEDEVDTDEGEALDQDYGTRPHDETSMFEREKNEVENPEDSQPPSDKLNIEQLQSEKESASTPGPKKIRIVIKDFAYATYRAVLYYLYTDTIVFAPLSSAFYSSVVKNTLLSSSYPSASSSQITLNLNSGEQCMGGLAKELNAQGYDNKLVQGKKTDGTQGPASRKEWLEEWRSGNSNRVSPCSAKAVYRLADSMNTLPLNSTTDYIVKSLTAFNVPYEVFSSFSAMFEDVRKVQVEYFLKHWSDIRGSEAMRVIWRQIRLGRHPGFEEVWPMIAVNLDFNARNEEKID
ncbi:hypothetical protein Clacol_003749 [Clathrus columnatus]|uniref:MATH domain-containing protein n=1 Tax=Clathrus columnatus TaxID=1419009 RepID=A0AAV5A4E4_9AGAM|nr:hypothetical protein Clacol_003749 [Clathrus columnatus]